MALPVRLDSNATKIAAVIAAAVLFLAINVIANLQLGDWRYDATEGRAFTVSKQIKPVFEGIDEPVTLRLYYSEALGAASPQHANLYRRVRELLDQYVKLAKGKIKVEYENPEPFSDTEDRAVGFGLQGVPLGKLGEVGYFGLAGTNATDDQQVIPFFNLEREQFVEYDLTKLIYSLSRPNQPKIGLVSSLPIEGGMGASQFGMQRQPSPPWAIMDQVKDFFDIQPLEPTLTEIPKDIGTLMLVQPTDLSPAAQYAIDQFVFGGGKVLAFVDPNPESGGPMGGVAADLSGIKQLMAAWGVSLVDGKVVGDLDSAIRVSTESGGRNVESDYVAWLQLGESNLDSKDAITGDIKSLGLGTPGILEKVQGATTTVTPLIVTGPNSMRIDVAKLQGLPDVVALFRDFKPSGKREVIGARITGLAKTAFPDGPPKTDAKPANAKSAENKSAENKSSVQKDADKPAESPGSQTASPQLKEAAQPIQVVVVADTDLLTDRFWVQETDFMGQRVAVPIADNAALVVNALENLSGSPALSSLRGRGVQNRPFVLIESIRRQAELQYRAKEDALLHHLDDLQKRVASIQLKGGKDDAIQLSDADRAAIESYRGEILSTRHELRDVQRALRQNIDRLEAIIKFINIGAVPILFGIGTIVVAAIGRRRRAVRI